MRLVRRQIVENKSIVERAEVNSCEASATLEVTGKIKAGCQEHKLAEKMDSVIN